MQITVLIENTSNHPDLLAEHGLSYHIALDNLNLLMDVGGGPNFLSNAEALGIDIAAVDYLILSHAHGDHGGGLEAFLEANQKAKVLVRAEVFHNYYSRNPDGSESYIGLNQEYRDHERVIFSDDAYTIAPGIELFSEIELVTSRPDSNYGLMQERDGKIIQDDFLHEQCLLIQNPKHSVLFTGCSHNGIRNIVGQATEMLGHSPDIVIGGFHLMNTLWERNDSAQQLAKIGRELLETDATFYTGHCTGTVAFERLKQVMGDRIHYFAGGERLVLE